MEKSEECNVYSSLTLQQNISLMTNFSNQKLLAMMTNLNTNLQNIKLLVTKIITIMNKKL